MFAGAGDVVEQVFNQLILRKCVQRFNAMNREYLDFFIKLAQQVFDGHTDFDCVDLQCFSQGQTDVPQRCTCCTLRKFVQSGKHFLQIAQVFVWIDTADKTGSRVLIHLPQLFHHFLKLLVVLGDRQPYTADAFGRCKIRNK